MSDHAQHADHGHEEHDHGPVFVNVFIGLVVLTATSFFVGNWDVTMSRPLVGWTLMMAISCAKAMLVISFFMHLRWEANWKYVLTIPASIMSLFLVLMLVPDVMQRGNYLSEERLRYSAVPEPDAIAESDDHGGDDHAGHDDHAGEGH